MPVTHHVHAVLSILIVLIAGGATQAASPLLPAGPNLIRNPGFESTEVDEYLDPARGWALFLQASHGPEHRWMGGVEHGGVGYGHSTTQHQKVGKRSGMIQSFQGGTLQFRQQVRLKPYTWYRFGGWYRSEGPGVRIEMNVFDESISTSLLGSGRWGRYGTQPWQRKDFVFYSGPREKTEVWLRIFSSSPGKAWFDEVELRELAVGDRTNVLVNSSFEFNTNPGTPDEWMNEWEGYGTHWRTTDEEAYDGRASLQIRGPMTIKQYIRAAPWAAGDEVTFSAYLKAAAPRTPVTLMVGDQERAVEVSDAWQRYSITSTVTDASVHIRQHPRAYFTVAVRSERPVWVDAVQLERGGSATDYHRSPLDEELEIDPALQGRFARSVPGFERPQLEPIETVEVRGDAVYVNGKPFFAIGSWGGWPAFTPKWGDRWVDQTGVNLMLFAMTDSFFVPAESPGEIPGTKFDELLPVIESHWEDYGLYVAPYLKHMMREHFTRMPNGTPHLEGIRQYIDRVGGQPNILTWFLDDEINYQPFGVLRAADTIRQHDPKNRPVYMNQWSAAALAAYRPAIDIGGLDVYPVPHFPVVDMGAATRSAVQMHGPDKPVWMWLQMFKHDRGVWGREPTPKEQRLQSYLAAIHGATGLLYFHAAAPDDPELWEETKQLTREFSTLGPVLIAGEEVSMPESLNRDGFAATARSHEGRTYWIVVNASGDPQSLEAPAPGIVGEVLFEGREVTASAGTLKDRFAPYETHVYAW